MCVFWTDCGGLARLLWDAGWAEARREGGIGRMQGAGGRGGMCGVCGGEERVSEWAVQRWKCFGRESLAVNEGELRWRKEL